MFERVELEMASKSIALLGDSILDNFYWLSDPSDDLTAQLHRLRYSVHNLAVDESQLVDILQGIIPKSEYVLSRKYAYPMNEEGRVQPLSLLKSSGTDLAVISVGGNDLRAHLNQLVFGVETFIQTVFTSEYLYQFSSLLSTIRTITPKVIIICPYCPYLGPRSRYHQLEPFREELLIRVRTIYLHLGRQHNLPVLDLSRSFNPYYRFHYGSTEIEPSNESSACLASLIAYIDRNYRGYAVYYAPECHIRNLRIE